MKGVEYEQPRGQKFTVMADGKFHQSVPEGTEGATARNWESKDGKSKGTKHEFLATSLNGTISNVTVFEGEFGDSLVISLDTGEDTKKIYMGASSNFGEDFLKKLPNIKLEEEVKITPYAFEDNGKKRAGLTIRQGENKIVSHYNQADDVKIGINGYPTPAGDVSKYKSDDWKLFFLTARKFLLEELKKSPVYNKVQHTEPTIAYPDGPSADDIPF